MTKPSMTTVSGVATTGGGGGGAGVMRKGQELVHEGGVGARERERGKTGREGIG